MSSYRFQIFIIGVFFFLFGFITWTNGILIPYLTIACDLEHEWQSYLVTFAFYISYTLFALPSGVLLSKTGMLKGMQLGLLIMSIGCVFFVPSALTRSYPLFLLGLFIIGGGMTVLQTAVNPYITLLGPPESAAKRISIMGVCNKFAGMLAPLILGYIILTNVSGLEEQLKTITGQERETRLNELAHKVILPFAVIAVVLAIVSFLIKFAHLPEVKPEKATDPSRSDSTLSILKYPGVMAGFIAIFFAVAAEVIAGDTIGRYGQYHGFSLEVAGRFTSFTLFSMIAGYLLGVFMIPKYISQEKAFLYSNYLGIALTVTVLLTTGTVSVICLGFLGFANALLWPAIWPTTLKNLPVRMVGVASALLIMGIAGGAIMPLIYGALADVQNKQMAYWILFPGYLFNIFYWNRYMKTSNFVRKTEENVLSY